MSATFEAIKRRRLSDEVSAQIQMRIASGELRSGDKLPPERELAARFGVSRGAVREALRTLERTGLVALQAGSRGGAFIGHGDPGLIGDSFRNLYLLGSVSLDELTEARQWLESTVVRMVARAPSRGPRRARSQCRRGREAVQGRVLRRQDRRPHRISQPARARHPQSPSCIMLMGALMEVMRDFAHAVGGERNDLTIKARRRLLDHLRKRDAARCGGGDGRASRQPALALSRPCAVRGGRPSE